MANSATTKEYFKTKMQKLRVSAESYCFKPDHPENEKAKVVLQTLDYLEGTESSPITIKTEKKK